MGLKILHSADWHLDSPFAGFSKEQREYLKKEAARIPEKIADLCRIEGCDLVLLSGDLFDGPYTKQTARIMKQALERCAVPVMIAPGNHDFLSGTSPWLGEAWPENVHIFREGISSVCLPELDCRVWGAGYTGMDCPALLDGFRTSGEETYQLAVLHADPVDLHAPYCPVTAAQIRDSGLDYLALGHIHKAGFFRAGKTLCGWPGTPMGRGYDELREKGVYLVEIQEKAALEFIPLDTPRFYDLEADTDTVALAQILPSTDTPWFYRLTLTGSGEESLSKIKKRYAHIPNLELIDHREAPVDPWQGAGEDSLEGIYFRLLRDRAEKCPEEAECIRLAAEISQKILREREVVL